LKANDSLYITKDNSRANNLDSLVESPSAALRFNFVVAAYLQYDSLLSFCAPGIWTFYETIVLLTFYEIITLHPLVKSLDPGK
jgi:hypothetical protein